jgi:hypothetical protein
MYFVALICFEHSSPSAKVTGWRSRSVKREMMAESSRKSILVPTRITGRGAVVANLRSPFGLDIVFGGWGDHREAREEHIGLRIGKGTKAVVVFLSSGIPEAKMNRLVIHHDITRVVVKDGGNVVTREGVGCVRDEKARLSDSTVSNSDTLDRLH